MKMFREQPEPVITPTRESRQLEQADEIDLGAFLIKLWRGKVWIVTMASVAILGGSFQAANIFPTFQADALVQLEDRSGRMGLPIAMQEMAETAGSAVTETEIIRSRMVLGQVVAEQNLDWQIRPEIAPVIGTLMRRYDVPLPELRILTPFARRGESIAVDVFQVPPQWLGRGIRLTVTESGYVIATPDGVYLEGREGELLRAADMDFAINISEINAPAGREYNLRQIALRQAIDRVRGQLSVSESGRQSNILELRLTGGDREQIERVLEAITTAYVRQNIARSAAEAETGLEFIRNQLPIAEQKLRDAQEALNRFREETSDRALARESLDGLEATAFESQALLGQISRAEAELRTIDQKIEESMSRYPEGHLIFRQLGQEKERVEMRLSELLAQVQNLPETQREIINLSREVELAQQIFFDLQSRAQEMQVLSASAIGSVRILDAASAQRSPVGPNRGRILALSGVLGLMLGLGIVLVLDWLRRGVRDASDLEALNLPVFATINYTPEADFKHNRKGKLPILSVDRPDDLVVEAIRSLRTSLHFGMLDAKTKAIVITSCAPKAGKSFISVNLAAVAAKAGQKVFLVDADLRRGQLRRHFDLPRTTPGLAQYLAGTEALKDVAYETNIERLYFIPTGNYPPNPSELLMRKELGKLVEILDKFADLIIIDSPPALPVTDPIILGKIAGSTILVARHDETTPAEIEAVQKNFNISGIRLAGSILNCFDPSKARNTYGYGYRYKYERRTD